MDGLGTITWEEFLENAEKLVETSTKISDGWELRGNKDVPGQAYIVRQSKQYISKDDSILNNSLPTECNSIDDGFHFATRPDPFDAISSIDEPLVTEYHVLWSMSYGVPLLYFNGWKSDFPGINLISVEEAQSFVRGGGLNYKELSQAMHPILGTPFLHLHPCKSQELLQVTSKSKNKVVSWLSTLAPAALNLRLRPEYYELTL